MQLNLATEQGFQALLAWGTILRGWTLAEEGPREIGVGLIRQGLATARLTGAKLGWPYYLALLTEAYGQGGQKLRLLDEALATVASTGERFYEAELYRLKGELTLQQENQKAKVKGQKSKTPNPKAEAEACFRKAIDIAQRQSAKSWKLRASTSLARLWQSQGKKKEAHKLLADIYGWFTEGFETKDLQEAKMLLEELSH